MIISPEGTGFVATGYSLGMKCEGRGPNKLAAFQEWVDDAIRKLEGNDPLNTHIPSNGIHTTDRRQQGVKR